MRLGKNGSLGGVALGILGFALGAGALACRASVSEPREAREPPDDAAQGGSGGVREDAAGGTGTTRVDAPERQAEVGGPDVPPPRNSADAPPATAAPALINVTTLKYDNARTGWNRLEKVLAPAKITTRTFDTTPTISGP